MTPNLVPNNSLYQRPADAVLASQFVLGRLSGGVVGSDGENGLSGKFGVALSFAARNAFGIQVSRVSTSNGTSLSALYDHIARVVLSSSEEQVARPNTGTHVAFMEDKQVIWDGAVCQNPRHAVSANASAARRDGEVAVAIPCAGRPKPASAIGFAYWNRACGFINFAPEPFVNCHAASIPRRVVSLDAMRPPA